MNKNKIIDIKNAIIENRLFSVLFFSMVLLGMMAIIDNLLTVSPKDALIWTRYNSYDTEKFYRNNWYYFYLFPFFNLILVVFNSIFSIKFLKSKHANLATTILFVTIILLVLSLIYFNKLISL